MSNKKLDEKIKKFYDDIEEDIDTRFKRYRDDCNAYVKSKKKRR